MIGQKYDLCKVGAKTYYRTVESGRCVVKKGGWTLSLCWCQYQDVKEVRHPEPDENRCGEARYKKSKKPCSYRLLAFVSG